MGTYLHAKTDKETLCKLAGVDPSVMKQHEEFEKFIDERTSEFTFEYKPKMGECILGKVTHPETENHPAFRNIKVKMPDGTWVMGNTSHQGEQTYDASYLIYKWRSRNHPEVDRLKDFLLFGWGKVRFPESWKGTKIAWSEEDYNSGKEFPLGSYGCGATKTKDEIREMSKANGLWLSEDDIAKIEFLYWS